MLWVCRAPGRVETVEQFRVVHERAVAEPEEELARSDLIEDPAPQVTTPREGAFAAEARDDEREREHAERTGRRSDDGHGAGREGRPTGSEHLEDADHEERRGEREHRGHGVREQDGRHAEDDRDAGEHGVQGPTVQPLERGDDREASRSAVLDRPGEDPSESEVDETGQQARLPGTDDPDLTDGRHEADRE